jgi:hypothetical protein
MHYYLCNVPNVTTLSDSTTTDIWRLIMSKVIQEEEPCSQASTTGYDVVKGTRYRLVLRALIGHAGYLGRT